MHTSVTKDRICWRLTELPAVTGLSLPYWRKMTMENKLTVRRIGRAVVVMNDDLLRFLTGLDEGTENNETRASTGFQATA